MAELFGPYRLDGLLGRGGMGEVWRAYDTEQDRFVALKLLPAWLSDDEEYRARFRREARIAATLNEPHVIPIHRFGEHDGRLYLDMRIVEGVDLADLVEEQGPLEAGRAVALVEQVAAALDAAHDAGLVHRDVKPSNVLIRPGPPEFAYLVDFGVARSLGGTRISVTGSAVGTPAYMAPERFEGEGDHRGDVYALGCLLFETLTGRPAFVAPNVFAYLRVHESQPPPRPTADVPTLPSGFDDVVACALAKDPTDRFDSTGALAAAARDALASPRAVTREMPSSTPTPTPTRPATSAPAGRPPLTTAAPPPAGTASPSDEPLAGDLLAAPAYPVTGPDRDAPTAPPPAEPVPGHTPAAPAYPVAGPDRDAPTAPPPVEPVPGHTPATPARPVATAPPAATAPPSQPATPHPTLGAPPPPAPATTDRPPPQATTGPRSQTTRAVGSLPPPAPPAPPAPARRRWWPFAAAGIALVAAVAMLVALLPGGQVLRGHDLYVTAVTTAQLDGRTVVVSGGTDGVRRWDLSTGDPIGDLVPGGVRAIATAQDGGRTIVAAAGAGVARWDLATAEAVGPALDQYRPLAVATAPGEDGGPIVVTGGDDDAVHRWNLRDGTPIGQPLSGHTADVTALAVAESNGRRVIVSGDANGVVRTWDLATGLPTGYPVNTGRTVRAVGAAQLDGETVILAGGEDSTVHRWKLATGEQIGPPLTGHRLYVTALTTGTLGGRQVIVSGGGLGDVRVWDLATGAPVGEPLTGHDDIVTGVALAELDGRTVIVSGSSDGTVRIEDAPTTA